MEPTIDEELVQVMVPRSKLTKVYALLAEDSSNGAPTSNGLHRGWSAELIREAYGAASDRMKALLDLLASRPDEGLLHIDFQKALGLEEDQVNGVLGAFGRLTNQRFAARLPHRENTWPFSIIRDPREDKWRYEMPAAVADVIRAIER